MDDEFTKFYDYDLKPSLIGVKYGRLTVVGGKKRKRRHTSPHGSPYRYYFDCVCECGNRCIKDSSCVKRGHTMSCGCLQRETMDAFWEAKKLPKGEASFNEVYAAYRKGARRRGYSFELDKEQFREIIVKPCIYCGDVLCQVQRERMIKGRGSRNGTFRYTGIDRYDNTKGYTLENSVPCCKKCNQMKMSETPKDFLERMEKILSRKSIWYN